MFWGRSSWVRFSWHFRNLQHRRFCNNPNSLNKQQQQEPHISNGRRENGLRDLEAYRDLDKLDFMKAAKILFSDPPKKKKFGLDFHLVQLFFALMPPLAVYLVAQYARYEMRKMEAAGFVLLKTLRDRIKEASAELEQKKKAEEEEKAKEMEKLAEEKGQESDPVLLKVKERLEALEQTVKEIVVETKKQPSDEKSRSADQIQEREDPKSRLNDRPGKDPKSRLNDRRDTVRKKPQEETPGLDRHDSEKRGSHQGEKK